MNHVYEATHGNEVDEAHIRQSITDAVWKAIEAHSWMIASNQIYDDAMDTAEAHTRESTFAFTRSL